MGWRWVWALSGWIPWGAKEWCHLRECSPSFSKFTSLINLIGQLIMEIYKRKSMSIDEVLRDKWAIRKRKCQRCESHWYFLYLIVFFLSQHFTLVHYKGSKFSYSVVDSFLYSTLIELNHLHPNPLSPHDSADPLKMMSLYISM